jgi:hypothetical protein
MSHQQHAAVNVQLFLHAAFVELVPVPLHSASYGRRTQCT